MSLQTPPQRHPSPEPLLRSPEELDDPDVSAEPVFRVATARVAWANYRLLRQDFPQLRGKALVAPHPELRELPTRRRPAACRRLIDDWLLCNAAVVSRGQLEAEGVNTPIEVHGEPVEAYRPPRYGRAVVVSLANNRGALPGALEPAWDDEPDGLLDVKGAGVAPGVRATTDVHGTGLMELGEALSDLVFQEAVEAVFRHARTLFTGVPVYAVLDLGFDLRKPGGEEVPAGLQVRRSHRRPRGGAELPPSGSDGQFVKFEIEMLLRQYGITSSNVASLMTIERRDDGRLEIFYGGHPVDKGYWRNKRQEEEFLAAIGADGPARFEGVNVQLTREIKRHPSRAQLVDFGSYGVHERFEHPVLSLVCDRLMRWGRAIGPENPHFPVPHEDFRLPMEHWGWRPLRALAAELAAEVRAGRLAPNQLRARLNNLLLTATERLERRPAPPAAMNGEA